jgi:hypothetical protein
VVVLVAGAVVAAADVEAVEGGGGDGRGVVVAAAAAEGPVPLVLLLLVGLGEVLVAVVVVVVAARVRDKGLKVGQAKGSRGGGVVAPLVDAAASRHLLLLLLLDLQKGIDHLKRLQRWVLVLPGCVEEQGRHGSSWCRVFCRFFGGERGRWAGATLRERVPKNPLEVTAARFRPQLAPIRSSRKS